MVWVVLQRLSIIDIERGTSTKSSDENGVSFDNEDVYSDNEIKKENNEKKDGAVVKKKNDMSNDECIH